MKQQNWIIRIVFVLALSWSCKKEHSAAPPAPADSTVSVIGNWEYTIVKDSTVNQAVCLQFPEGQFGNRIIYDQNYNDPKYFLQVADTKLTLVTGCFSNDTGTFKEYAKQ